MSLAETIMYLQVFGLIVFDLFFLLLIIFSIYFFFAFYSIKKRALALMDTTQSLVENIKVDSENISKEIVEKVQSVNMNKVAITGGIGSTIFLITRSLFQKKKKSSGIADILHFLLK